MIDIFIGTLVAATNNDYSQTWNRVSESYVAWTECVVRGVGDQSPAENVQTQGEGIVRSCEAEQLNYRSSYSALIALDARFSEDVEFNKEEDGCRRVITRSCIVDEMVELVRHGMVRRAEANIIANATGYR
ncbi:MAG: hypothetical protein KF780_13335 [Sphingomonas sp.]|nr:hypothetical protein [Sphingomonas sp.]